MNYVFLGTECLGNFLMSKNTDMNYVFLGTECLGNLFDDQTPSKSVARILSFIGNKVV